MKKLPLLAAGLGLLVLIAPSSALAQKALGPKGKLFAKYDTNKNGVIDGDEIAAMQKDYTADPTGDLKRYDTNSDGKLDEKEIAAIKPPGSGKSKDGEKSKGKSKDADVKAADPKPEDAKPADVKPADPKAADAKPEASK